MSIANNAPEDTSARPAQAHLLGMLGGSSDYITGMESAGQRQLLATTALPSEGPWDSLIELGFVKGQTLDDLFVNATLPEGWSKQGSDHAMHSYIVDERGVKRVNVFYKAAFYDRRADLHLVNPGYMACTEALYGDGDFTPPSQWDVFTDAERATFVAGCDGMAERIRETPSVYGCYAARLREVRSWLASVSA